MQFQPLMVRHQPFEFLQICFPNAPQLQPIYQICAANHQPQTFQAFADEKGRFNYRYAVMHTKIAPIKH